MGFTVGFRVQSVFHHVMPYNNFPVYMKDSWYSLIRIIDWYGDHQDEMIPVAGPGHWNDPDQVH